MVFLVKRGQKETEGSKESQVQWVRKAGKETGETKGTKVYQVWMHPVRLAMMDCLYLDVAGDRPRNFLSNEETNSTLKTEAGVIAQRSLLNYLILNLVLKHKLY
uniref:Uncharacterized protein n=1 Tax=Cacopsylla melanoneura TaxID=428564 RepID=A0A8D9ARI4_9HEMI